MASVFKFWATVLIIIFIALLILKYRDNLDLRKTLPVGIVGVIIAFLGNLALIKLGYIAYNQKQILFPILGIPPLQALTAGIVAMIMVHFISKNKHNAFILIAGVDLMVNLVTLLSVQNNVMRFIHWNLFINYIFDYIALVIMYYAYLFFYEKNERNMVS